jgi:hypothetical protein
MEDKGRGTVQPLPNYCLAYVIQLLCADERTSVNIRPVLLVTGTSGRCSCGGWYLNCVMEDKGRGTVQPLPNYCLAYVIQLMRRREDKCKYSACALGDRQQRAMQLWRVVSELCHGGQGEGHSVLIARLFAEVQFPSKNHLCGLH